eukprot:TRINITY_DN1108_c0_g1_i1.p1 TRINITY_DN1108_c0_g1~~TRINITY_DN1108_c0_g1_i1.p1  ORF type:complete len:170 (-),score=25.73 TRINITY_DN1108_c0_g1_i1:60-569(-)
MCGIGCDLSKNLVEISQEKGLNVLCGDILALPFRDKMFDATICVAVVQHLASSERRLQALRELVRVTKINGSTLVYVWALEQGSNSRRRFTKQDVLIPWKLPPKYRMTENQQENEVETEKDEDSNTYHRFIHVFKKGELEQVCGDIPGVEVAESFWDASNWCVVIRRIS